MGSLLLNSKAPAFGQQIRKKRNSKSVLWRSLFFLKDKFWTRLSWNFFALFLDHERLHARIVKPYQVLYANEVDARKKSFPFPLPQIRRASGVLKKTVEVQHVLEEVLALHLPLYPVGCRQKYWDSLAALSFLLRSTNKNSSILDAGGYYYSPILPWLALYGYTNLVCLNLSFKKSDLIGTIRYEPGDLTRTDFPDDSFDAVTCISVVEHGIDTGRYFKEMSRILKPGGLLFTSVDYWPETMDTSHVQLFGMPLTIFDKGKLFSMKETAEKHNFVLLKPLQWEAGEKLVKWKKMEFTFAYFTLKNLKGNSRIL